MRIINIYVNNFLVSKNRDEIYDWLERALKQHLEFKILWKEIKRRKLNERML